MKSGQIYTSGKVTTDIPQPGFRASDMANSGVEQQLERQKQDALVMYEQGLQASAAQSMADLYDEYGDDPQALSQQLNELNQKMSSEIPDLKMKVGFKTQFITKSQSLVNRAQANYDKVQYEKKKSSYFDTIQNNNKVVRLAFENAFSGNATADDLVNYQVAINQNKSLINAQNDDGTYIFSDAQRLVMSKDVDALASDSFGEALASMDEDKRTQLLANLENDNVILLSAEDDDKNIRQLNLKDAVDDITYSDMKKTAKILDNKIKKAKVQEWNMNKAYSAINLMSNPNEQNYHNWLYYNQDASDEKKNIMQQIAGFVPDEDIETTFEGYDDAYEAIKELSNMPNSTMAEKNLIEDKAMSIVQRLHNSNHSVDDEGNIRISSDDLQKTLQMVNSTLSDDVFKKQVSEMPDMAGFKKFMSFIDAPVWYTGERINMHSKIGEIAQGTMRDIQNIVMSPEIADDDKRDAIHRTYEKGMEAAIKARYYWIPDLQKPLKKGESIVEINGRQYLYQGIGDDIFLEVKE